ncbi:GGDEF domain-containing response regulator [Thalassotalea profundi]|uniref:Transcriptional regulator n=1 Tax=Thalassotalea profundi TaxID=2036687 RepID=A0ABQ3INZ0_9GAMM|nr:response regulator [Thalassotalea profundi]GHE88271.1 transcriptional regulator [Thalassotalea profundi]
MLKKRLLIVEDSKPIALVIEHMAKSVGYDVTIAHSLSEVKKLLAKDHNFFVATLDYGLPDASDGEVIPFIIEHDIPAIIMTGRMDDNTHKKLLNFPIVDYVTKENSQAYHYLMMLLHGQLTNHKIGVLVVDDSLTGRNHIQQLLLRRNFTVYCVSDGTKALKALDEKEDIKLVITNHEMPGMDGVELVQRIRRKFSRTEMIIIGVSNSKGNYQSARFIKNGADDFLRAPFCPEEFYCRVIQNIEKLQYIEEIESAVNSDYLTSISNRRYFVERVSKQLNNLEISDLIKVLAVVHIDDFKSINDKHKHEAGDEVLISFASLLSESFSEDDIVARLSGAEFAIFSVDEKSSGILEKLKKLQADSGKRSVKFGNININFTVSIGGLVTDTGDGIHESLAKAVEVLNGAMNKGKSQLLIEGATA